MIVTACPIEGTYLIRDETQPIPLGKTATDVSTVVYRYKFGWVCASCGFVVTPFKAARNICEHIQAAGRAAK